ncbi:leucine rich repeat protein, partial [Aureobasidium melanogenum]
MPRSSSREHAGRRRSIFGIPSFTQIHPTTTTTRDSPDKLNKDSSKTLKKRRGPTLVTNLESSPELVHDEDPSPVSAGTLPSPKPVTRPSLSVRSGGRPVSSVFGSLRSMRSMHEDDTPLTTTSSRTPSINWADFDTNNCRKGRVLHHGEVQTSSSMFRKKKEYLVLTDTHILRYKNQSKAAETIGSVPPPFGRSPTIRHSSTNSIGSSQDLQSLHSDSSGDKEGRVTLRHIVAVHRLDDGRPYFAIEVCYLDEEGSQASAMVMQFGESEDRDLWLRSIRQAANKARLQDVNPISVVNSKNAARAVERENDYDPANYAIYKVVQRQFSKSRSSTDDLSKIASTVCFLAIEELTQSCLLIQEVRALAATNKKLRRMDFSRCIVAKPPDYTDDSESRVKDIGCGVVEALSPLCKHQITNVDWIALNGIHLSETDLDYLVGAASDKACHFRAIELSRCSLTDRTLSLILDSLRAQDNTLEALDISGNLARLAPAVFDGQISVFGFIRKLNLSFASRTSGAEPLFNAETLLTWRLEELRLTGTSLNEHTIQALATYLKHPQSDTLR